MTSDNIGRGIVKILNYCLSGGLFFKCCLNHLEPEVLELVSSIILFDFFDFLVNIKDMLVAPFKHVPCVLWKLLVLSLLNLGP